MDSITKDVLVVVSVSTSEASTTSNASGFHSLAVTSGITGISLPAWLCVVKEKHYERGDFEQVHESYRRFHPAFGD